MSLMRSHETEALTAVESLTVSPPLRVRPMRLRPACGPKPTDETAATAALNGTQKEWAA